MIKNKNKNKTLMHSLGRDLRPRRGTAALCETAQSQVSLSLSLLLGLSPRLQVPSLLLLQCPSQKQGCTAACTLNPYSASGQLMSSQPPGAGALAGRPKGRGCNPTSRQVGISAVWPGECGSRSRVSDWLQWSSKLCSEWVPGCSYYDPCLTTRPFSLLPLLCLTLLNQGLVALRYRFPTRSLVGTKLTTDFWTSFAFGLLLSLDQPWQQSHATRLTSQGRKQLPVSAGRSWIPLGAFCGPLWRHPLETSFLCPLLITSASCDLWPS